TVQASARPPKRSDASRTVISRPGCSSLWARARPSMPPPTMHQRSRAIARVPCCRSCGHGEGAVTAARQDEPADEAEMIADDPHHLHLRVADQAAFEHGRKFNDPRIRLVEADKDFHDAHEAFVIQLHAEHLRTAVDTEAG